MYDAMTRESYAYIDITECLLTLPKMYKQFLLQGLIANVKTYGRQVAQK
ncbi:hypothetical protein M975_0474 [Buttiauxella brennerae ATCC 51605]|uniref:Uncharacterized protein n=1 Tax=Buttiauxella brennerae ATCC 51605 TaxID=1354251 RepID=A0A1B7IVF3_9ENTR|nr:hypothetical protein M975_0474 [Buttiauxella brennerae ATCC 51605]